MTRVLVGYASRHGATAEIAQAIADKLRESRLDVDCRPLADVGTLHGYDAVVIGSALYMQRWRPSARRFLHRHAAALADRRLWAFSSGPVGPPRAVEPGSLEPRHIVAELERLGVREHVVFGGRVPDDPRGLLERAVVRGVEPHDRDQRDWAQIREWAADIADALTGAPAR